LDKFYVKRLPITAVRIAEEKSTTVNIGIEIRSQFAYDLV